MDSFLEFMAEILETEVENISMDTDFRNDIEDWGSMKGFMIICMIAEEYGIMITVQDFLKCKKISDLFEKATSH